MKNTIKERALGSMWLSRLGPLFLCKMNLFPHFLDCHSFILFYYETFQVLRKVVINYIQINIDFNQITFSLYSYNVIVPVNYSAKCLRSTKLEKLKYYIFKQIITFHMYKILWFCLSDGILLAKVLHLVVGPRMVFFHQFI